MLPQAEVTAVALEFGTYPLNQLLDSFRLHALLSQSSQLSPEREEQVRSTIQDFFYPGTQAWLNPVWARTVQVTQQALVGLSIGR
jgi:hypothetical protein